jgi:hypothetical protein
MSQEETSCHMKKLSVTGRNFLPQEETSCHKKKLPVTGRNFLSQEELPVKGRNFLSQEETSCHCKKLPFTRRSIEKLTYKWMSTRLRKRWRLLKMFLCFKMIKKSLKML